MQMNFTKPEDFIEDESFLAWVNRSDESSIAQWELWITNNPDKKIVVEEAIMILGNFFENFY